LTLRPWSFGPLAQAREGCRMLEPVADHAILEERIESVEGSRQPRTRHYWLDPERDHAVVRVIDRLPNGTAAGQIDIQYESVGDEAVPAGWVAMTLDQAGDTTSFVYAGPASVSPDISDIEARLRVDIPAETRVVDRIVSQTYVVKPDGSRDVEGQEPGQTPGGTSNIAERRRVRQFVQASLRWPGILVTISCAGAMIWCVKRARRWMARTSGAAADQRH